ncbi:MAG: DUF2065 family protein [Pseudomonadota bacterium]
MDLLAALALMLILEGLALAIMARSLPEILAAMKDIDKEGLQRIGLVCIGLGVVAYLTIRGGFSG